MRRHLFVLSMGYEFSPIESVTEINKELENLNEDIEKLMKEI